MKKLNKNEEKRARNRKEKRIDKFMQGLLGPVDQAFKSYTKYKELVIMKNLHRYINILDNIRTKYEQTIIDKHRKYKLVYM